MIYIGGAQRPRQRVEGQALINYYSTPLGIHSTYDLHHRDSLTTCLDGRYGDSYPMASPETVRLCLGTTKRTYIPNDHENMKCGDTRLQKLEVSCRH